MLREIPGGDLAIAAAPLTLPAARVPSLSHKGRGICVAVRGIVRTARIALSGEL